MGTVAYLICEKAKTAYDLGKFFGTWASVDWSETDETTFGQRIQNAWCGGGTKKDESQKRYAWALGGVLFRFCVTHSWAVEVVGEDYFFDEAQLDVHRYELGRDLPFFTLVGSRWPDSPPLGRGYDIPKAWTG